MCEIKFRGWNKELKKMAYNLQKIIPEFSPMPEVICSVEPVFYEGTKESVDVNFFKEFLELKNWDVMQYIGVTDSTGREIYEGDVVETSSPVDRGEVKRVENKFLLHIYEKGSYVDICWNLATILGNKWQ